MSFDTGFTVKSNKFKRSAWKGGLHAPGELLVVKINLEIMFRISGRKTTGHTILEGHVCVGKNERDGFCYHAGCSTA